jgi:hypothetical protein
MWRQRAEISVGDENLKNYWTLRFVRVYSVFNTGYRLTKDERRYPEDERFDQYIGI